MASVEESERSAHVALARAEDALIAASLRGDTADERHARDAIAATRRAINAARMRRLSDKTAARLDELAPGATPDGSTSDDPVGAAARGELTFPEAVQALKTDPSRFLEPDEERIFTANPSALRLIVCARIEQRPVGAVIADVERGSVEGLYAARAGSPDEVKKLVSLLREQGVLPAEPGP